MDYEKVTIAIRSNSDEVNLGDSGSPLVPSAARIKETENFLGQSLPPSFVWFLKNFGGGTIFGDPLYYIPNEYSCKNMMDVAAKTLADRENGLIETGEISLCITDFGEYFVFDTNNPRADGEYPVVRKTGDICKVVANDFADFLVKFIGEEIS
jgi:hypothetical protein